MKNQIGNGVNIDFGKIKFHSPWESILNDFVTSAKKNEHCKALLNLFNFPLRKPKKG